MLCLLFFVARSMHNKTIEENRSYTYYYREKLFSPKSILQKTHKQAKNYLPSTVWTEVTQCALELWHVAEWVLLFTKYNRCCDIRTCCPQFPSLRRWEFSHFLFHVFNELFKSAYKHCCPSRECKPWKF